MAGMSTYLATKILRETFTGKNLYFALFTDDPTDDNDTSKEVVATWYERRPVTFGEPQRDSEGMHVVNTASVLLPRVITDVVTFKAWGVYDAASGGNLLGYELFPHPGATPTVGFTFGIDVGLLKFKGL